MFIFSSASNNLIGLTEITTIFKKQSQQHIVERLVLIVLIGFVMCLGFVLLFFDMSQNVQKHDKTNETQ